jgi:phytoene synthase
MDELGAAIARARLLLRVGHDGRQGRIYLPHEELRRFEVPAAAVLGGTQTPQLTALIRDQAERASRRMKIALRTLRPHRRTLKPALILGQLNIALLIALEEDGFQVALHRVSLTPLRKFLIAWRFARLSW